MLPADAAGAHAVRSQGRPAAAVARETPGARSSWTTRRRSGSCWRACSNGAGSRCSKRRRGAAALAVAAGVQLSLVLCDVRLPGMHGTELYRELIAQGSRAGAVLIFITGDQSSVAMDARRSARAGAGQAVFRRRPRCRADRAPGSTRRSRRLSARLRSLASRSTSVSGSKPDLDSCVGIPTMTV